MKRVFLVITLFCALAPAFRAHADEGMWLFNAFPKAKVQAKYGFAPTQKLLDHLRLGSVRFNNGGSGSFVSPDGLTFTNHHVGSVCIHQLSTGGRDYVKTGFYAKTRAEEAKCPDLELNQLIGIDDVTAKVKAAAKPEMSAADAAQAQRAVMSTLEKQCTATTGLRCDVITLYSGEVYHLYKYKKFTDVRLVFAPEFDMAFFGGDPDNFTYPRYDLDITFFRVYENDKPAHLDNYLHWASRGVKENDLIFVSGNPGSTGRLKTMSQLEYLRDVDYPSRLQTFQRRISLLQNFSTQSPENERIAQEDIFNYQNSFKAITGYESGLKDKAVMDKKAADEGKLHSAFRTANPNAPDPWEQISAAMKVQTDIYKPLSYLERMRGFNAQVAIFARTLVRVTEEKTQPNEKRLREYRESNLASVEQQLFSTAPVYKSLDTATLADSIAEMQQELGLDNPDIKAVLGGKSPQDAARYLVDNTMLDDLAFRKQLYQGGPAAIQASTDPLIVLMRNIDPEARALRKQYDDKVDAIERQDGASIARARFAKSGFTEPPDATFTLRLSYGAVRGYDENGKHIPYATQIAGAYERAAGHGSQPPYRLPESWMNAKSKLNLQTPTNYVSTADIIGGNSGSPTINRAGEVVGIIFDGNMQSLVWNFVYTDLQGRAVHVDSRVIDQALRNVYGAAALADELRGTSATTTPKEKLKVSQ
jgi:Peptidase S46